MPHVAAAVVAAPLHSCRQAYGQGLGPRMLSYAPWVCVVPMPAAATHMSYWKCPNRCDKCLGVQVPSIESRLLFRRLLGHQPFAGAGDGDVSSCGSSRRQQLHHQHVKVADATALWPD